MNFKEIYMEKYLAGSDLGCFQGSFKPLVNTIANHETICIQCNIRVMV